MSIARGQQRAFLMRLARQAMAERGLEPDFPPAAMAEARAAVVPAAPFPADVRDLRHLLWCSIDNDDSRDLDQLTVAEPLPGGGVKVLIAVADVSALVAAGSAVDQHAGANTTSIYTPPAIFPMLPERAEHRPHRPSIPHQDRLAVVVEMVVDGEGVVESFEIYRAVVHNQVQLAYSGVGPWLEGKGEMPAAHRRRPRPRRQPPPAGPGGPAPAGLSPGARGPGTRDHRGARALRRGRRERAAGRGAQPRQGADRGLHDHGQRRGGAVPGRRSAFRSCAAWCARPSAGRASSTIARELGEDLPAEPDAQALHAFLLRRRAADPLRFPDLSLTVIKLLGRGRVRGQPARARR